MIFNELSKTYLSSASAAGHAGDNAEMNKLVDILIKQGKNGKGVVGVRSLYEAARKVKPFEAQAGIMTRIKDHLIPMLDEKNYTCLIGDKIYINPRLLG